MSRRNRFCSIAAMATFDAVFVGSGINSLVGAALLAREGWSVCVLERNDVAGGCIRTSTDLTLPGYTHEVLAAWHPLFTGSAAYAELKDDLDRRGVTYVNTDLPTGTAFPDGSAAFITGSLEGNVAEFDRLQPGDGAAWERQFNAFMANADLSFGILSTELWSTAGLSLGRKALRRLGRRGLLEFSGNTLVSCRDWVTATFAVGSGARCPRSVGAPYRPRPGSGDVRLHDPGDRRSAPARRDAGARRRRRRRSSTRSPGSSSTPAGRFGSRPMSSGFSSRTAGQPACDSPTGTSSPRRVRSSPL